MTVRDETYEGRLTAMSDGELLTRVYNLFCGMYDLPCPGEFRVSKEILNRRLQTAFHVCMIRSRLDIYRESGNRALLKLASSPKQYPPSKPVSTPRGKVQFDDRPYRIILRIPTTRQPIASLSGEEKQPCEQS